MPAPAPRARSLVSGDDYCGDPFLLWQTVTETIAALPTDLRAMVVQQMADSDRPDVREAAVLSLLDGEPAVRSEAQANLREAVDMIGATALNRIEILSLWLPDHERSAIEGVAQAVRAKGIVPAPTWAAASVDFFASTMDHNGTVSLFAIVPDGRRKRLATVLGGRDVGIADAVLSGPMNGSKASRLVSEAGRDTPVAPVPLPYVRRWIGDLLAGHARSETVPPAGFLQVAETVGIRDWAPQPLDWNDWCHEQIATLSPRLVEPEGVEQVVAASHAWAKRSGITEGWMEDDEDAREMILAQADESGAPLPVVAMDMVLEARREKWAELCVRAGDWLREAYGDSSAWREFLLLGRELYGDRALREIPLMRTIATRTAVAAEWSPDSLTDPSLPLD